MSKTTVLIVYFIVIFTVISVSKYKLENLLNKVYKVKYEIYWCIIGINSIVEPNRLVFYVSMTNNEIQILYIICLK